MVISDGSRVRAGIPAITYGLRGIAYYELRLTGPDRDLHSGSFGGAVTNPANAISQILAGLIDRRGRVQIPGFYDDVLPLSPRERKEFAALPFDSGTFSPASASRRRWAKRATPRWSGVGRGPPSIYAACGAAIRARGRKPCSLDRRRENRLPAGAEPGPGPDRPHFETADRRTLPAGH